MGILKDEVIVVTGGSRGIGAAICEVFAEQGAGVAIFDVDQPASVARASEIERRHGVRVTFHECDVAQPEAASNAIDEVLVAHGHVDVLVNNAGVVGNHTGIDAIDHSDWEACHRVNVLGSWNTAKACLAHFRAQGGGKIINLASVAALMATPDIAHYAASKAAVLSMTRSLAKALGPQNITVNAVCPGLVWTTMWEELEEHVRSATGDAAHADRAIFDAAVRQSVPLRREQTPRDIALAILFLASSAADNITGQVLAVDGGMSL